jgi:hypothetical protein
MEMLLWVCNTMSRRFENGSVSIYLYVVVLVDMATLVKSSI